MVCVVRFVYQLRSVGRVLVRKEFYWRKMAERVKGVSS